MGDLLVVALLIAMTAVGYGLVRLAVALQPTEESR